jgi:hypothetical protein
MAVHGVDDGNLAGWIGTPRCPSWRLQHRLGCLMNSVVDGGANMPSERSAAVLGGKIMRADPVRDFIRLGEDSYIGFLRGEIADASEFLRSARSFWVEIKSDNVEEVMLKILEFGVRKLEVPDPHLTFRLREGNASG